MKKSSSWFLADGGIKLPDAEFVLKAEEFQKDQLDFEIDFFEGVIQSYPDQQQALIVLGNAYTEKGLYEEGLAIDKRLVKLRPRDPMVFYNLACSRSLLHQLDLAIEALEKSVELGYEDVFYIEEDHDLENVRSDARYKRLIGRLIQKKIKKV